MKKIIKEILNNLGYEINLKRKVFNFHKFKIDLVLDVGAHKGGFAEKLIKDGYNGKIISFEPQYKIYKFLKITSKKYKNWFLYPRCALGNNNTTLKLNIFSETQCS